MKLIKPIEWATQTNYTADGSSDPWRTGSSPTKVEPLPSSATQGMAPGERYAAQWENYVKNQYGVNDREARLDQLTALTPVQVSPITLLSRPTWDSYVHAWIQAGTGGGLYRDDKGQNLGTYTKSLGLSALQHMRSVNSPLFGVSYVPQSTTAPSSMGGDAVMFYYGGRDANSQNPLCSALGAPNIQYGIGRGCHTADGARIIVCGYNGTAPTLSAWDNNTRVVETLPAGLTQSSAARNASLVLHPSGTLYMFGAFLSEQKCVLQRTSAGVWSILQDVTNNLGGSVWDAPIWDDKAGVWVVIVDASTNDSAQNNSSRYRHRVWTGASLTALAQESAYSSNGFALLSYKHLGDGIVMGIARRWCAATTQGANPVSVTSTCVVVSTDYGRTWRDTGNKLWNITLDPFTTDYPSLLRQMHVDASVDNKSVSFHTSSQSQATYMLSRRGGDMTLL